MAITESTLQALVITYASNFAASGSAYAIGTYSVPAGATLKGIAGANSTSVTGMTFATTTGQTLTSEVTYNPNTMPLAVASWHNSGASAVNVALTVTPTYANNKTMGVMVQLISGDNGTPNAPASATGTTSGPELSATPSVVGSLFCFYYVQQGATTAANTFVTGSTGDTSPAGYGQGNGTGSDAMGMGVLYQTATNTQTSTPVTVGATLPSATTYGVMLEHYSSSPVATGTAELDYTATAATTSPATATGQLAYTASGLAAGSIGGTASLAYTASGAATAPTSGGAELDYTATGSVLNGLAGLAELDYTATGTVAGTDVATGTAILNYDAFGHTESPMIGGLTFGTYMDGDHSMKVGIQPGATFEVLTPGEHQKAMDTFRREMNVDIREWTRGLKVMRSTSPDAIPASGGFTQTFTGPEQGYSWMVQRVSNVGIATSDVAGASLLLYRTSDGTAQPRNFLTALNPNAATFFSSKSIFLLPGEYFVVVASGLTATTGVTFNAEVIEAPAEMLAKLF